MPVGFTAALDLASVKNAGVCLVVPAISEGVGKLGLVSYSHLMCMRMVVQVPIPDIIRYKMVGLGISVLVVTYAWEHWLRWAFPEPLPPQKGYMTFLDKEKHTQSKKKRQ